MRIKSMIMALAMSLVTVSAAFAVCVTEPISIEVDKFTGISSAGIGELVARTAGLDRPDYAGPESLSPTSGGQEQVLMSVNSVTKVPGDCTSAALDVPSDSIDNVNDLIPLGAAGSLLAMSLFGVGLGSRYNAAFSIPGDGGDAGGDASNNEPAPGDERKEGDDESGSGEPAGDGTEQQEEQQS